MSPSPNLAPRREIINPNIKPSKSLTKSEPAVRKATRENPYPKETLVVSDPKKLLRRTNISHEVTSSSKGKSASE